MASIEKINYENGLVQKNLLTLKTRTIFRNLTKNSNKFDSTNLQISMRKFGWFSAKFSLE